MKRYLFPLLCLLSLNIIHAQSYRNVSGFVTDENTSKPLPGCNIILKNSKYGATTNDNGFYSFKVPLNKNIIEFDYVGYEKQVKILPKNNNDIKLNVELIPTAIEVNQILVKGKKEKISVFTQELEQSDIKKMPVIYNDALRTLKIMPGVTSNNELSSSYNVRGGTFDENLIYLNGYEIYRPFLLQQGVEENQSVVNPDLVSNMQFYNGTIPARYGDKLSSALDINYESEFDKKVSGNFRVNMLNASVGTKGSYKKLNYSVAGRYAYPSLFLKGLQTDGVYKPQFYDIQGIFKYKIADANSIELFVLNSQNKYDLLPDMWIGNFRSDRGTTINTLTLDYEGEKKYQYNINLIGLKHIASLKENVFLKTAVSRYYTKEKFYNSVYADYYFSPDAYRPELDKEYLKRRHEYESSFSKIERFEIDSKLKVVSKDNLLIVGIDLRNTNLDFYKVANTSETGTITLLNQPIVENINNDYNIFQSSLFVDNSYTVSDFLNFNIGLRVAHYSYNDETTFSPRTRFNFQVAEKHKLSLAWGYYFQQPFFYELKNSDSKSAQKLKSQKSHQASLGWEWQYRKKAVIQIEAFYKDLKDLIPFYLDQLKLEYADANNSKGFSYGFDFTYKGEVTEGLRTWVGYSYLNTKEKRAGDTQYRRRILDQTHTIKIFFQDKIRKHPNWQSHLRILFGTGFLYHKRKVVEDAATGNSYTEVDWERRQEFSQYLRADMGLSASFDFDHIGNLLIIAEILNVFNNYNAGSYNWVQAFRDLNYPIRVPAILSKRFFNISAQLSF